MRDIDAYNWEILVDRQSAEQISHSGSLSVVTTIKVKNSIPFPPNTPRPTTLSNMVEFVIRDLLGTAAVNTDNGILTRKLPRRHPRFQHLFALEVLDVVGEGRPDPVRNPSQYPRGKYGDFEYWIFKVRFGKPLYLILSDSDIRDQIFQPDVSLPMQHEYLRYTEWLPMKPAIEHIARRGVVFSFSALGRQSGTRTFPGDKIFRANKGLLSCIWRNVPIDMVMANRVVPKWIYMGMGKLNAYTFPPSPLPAVFSTAWTLPPSRAVGNPTGSSDWPVGMPAGHRNNETMPLGFHAGTLLMLPPDILPSQYQQMVPENVVNLGTTLQHLYTDLVDVRFNFLYFNPETNEDMKFRHRDLRRVGGGGPEPRPDAVEQIRGHNLFPTPRANRVGNRYYSWYAADNRQIGLLAFPGEEVHESFLLYQYFNFERLFFCAGGLAGNFYEPQL